MDELDELFERKSELEERKNNFFEGDNDVHFGDQYYQDLLEQLDEVESETDKLMK